MRMVETARQFEPGSRLGAYEIVKELGRGGMGAVLLATDLDLDRYVAIKVLHPQLSAQLQNDIRFRREARMLSRLNHPNIVVVYAIGNTPSGAHYIVMEYAKGDSLRSRLRYGPLEPEIFSHIFEQICSAMADAHQHGIIHRDLKPENIQLTHRANDSDFVKVFDFGLATLDRREAGSRDPKLTHTDTFMGTPAYVSPEQAMGHAVDARTDIYALGVVACELLTGRLPIQSENPLGYLFGHINTAPTLPSDLRPNMGFTPEIDAVFARVLAKDPDARYPSVEDFAHSLIEAVQRWNGPQERPDIGTPMASAMTLDSGAFVRDPKAFVEAHEPSLLEGFAPASSFPTELIPDPNNEARLIQTVTVLHLDIDARFESQGKGSLEIQELMDCLEVVGARIHRAVSHHGGIPAGPLVSGQDVLFGLYDDSIIGHHEHAERAVDCALAIRSALSALSDDPTIPDAFALTFRLGLAQGRILLTHAGPGRTLLHGPPLRQAVQLATHLQPGDVYIANDVYRRVRGVFDCFAVQEPPTLDELEGNMRSVHKRKQLARRIRAEEIYGVPIEMQGRDPELRSLHAALELTLSTRHPQLVMVSGPAGLGKTRLVNEFIKAIEELSEVFFYESGRCTAARSASPYEPFAQAIRARSRIQSKDNAEQARIKLDLYLRHFLEFEDQDQEEATVLRTLLELFLGFDTHTDTQVHGEEVQRARLFEGIRLLYSRLSRVGDAPILFVLEDFQWSSAPTRALLGHLLAWLDVPILFLVVTREPESLQSDVASALASTAHSTLAHIPLDPLDDTHSEQLIRHMLRRLVTIPSWLVSNIASLADGVPLIMEETVHDLIDDGTLVIDSDRWELHQAAHTSEQFQLPKTVEQLFEGRLDRLEPELRTVLEAASVCGRRFWPQLLSTLTDGAIRAEKLAELVRRGFFRELGELWVEDESDFAFTQLAIQQVVYRSLSPRRRQNLHRITARWLVLHASRQVSGVDASIGYHYREAGVLEQALPYELRAVEHAKSMRALESVIEHLEHCRNILLELLPSHPDRLELAADVHAQLVRQLVLAGKLQRAIEVAEGATSIAPPASHAAYIDIWRGWALERLGRYAEALTAFLDARRHLDGLEDAALPELLARTGEAGARAKLGDAEASVRVLQKALQATPDQIPEAKLAEWKAALSTACRMYANAQLRNGAFDAAEGAYQKAYSMADAAVAPVLVIEALNGLGALNYYREQLEDAESTWRSALEIAEKWELLQHQALVLNNLGELLYARGKTADALLALRRAEALHHYLSSDEGLADTCRLIAACLLTLGELDEAADYAKQSLEVAQRVGSPYFVGRSHRTLARIAHAKASKRTQHVHHFAAVIRHLTASMQAFKDADLVTEIAATEALRKELLGS